jgi:DNA-binding MarR family transcriptional regulator
MTDRGVDDGDQVDLIRQQWAQEMPEIDTEAVEILGRARRLTLQVRPQIEAVFTRHGLDAGQFDVLATLRRAGEPFRLTPTELYRSLMISSGGLTDRLARLENAGLVRRRADEADRRSLFVELTDLGRDRIEAAFRDDMALERQLVAGLNEGERRQLADLLRKLALQVEDTSTG